MMFPVGRVPALVLEARGQRLAGRPRLAQRLARAGLARARAYTLPYERALAEHELRTLDAGD
jgi:hypothetical protein